MASALERSRFESWPGTLCCVLGKDTLLSQCLTPPEEYKWALADCWGNLTNGEGVT